MSLNVDAARDEPTIDVATDGYQVSTLVDAGNVALLAVWDHRTATTADVDLVLNEARRELEHEVRAFDRTDRGVDASDAVYGVTD